MTAIDRTEAVQESETREKKTLGEIVSNNLRELISEKGLTQAALADQLKVAAATMTDYCKGRRVPGAEFFVQLKEKFGISIDDFLTKTLDRASLSAPAELSALDRSMLKTYRKYCGSYFMYYFDTSKYKGRDDLPARDSLKYGVLFVYETAGREMPEYRCAALMGIPDRDEVTFLKKSLDSVKEPSKLIARLRDEFGPKAYFGSFELSEDHVFVSLYHGSTDKALAIFHRVDNNKSNYIGGIGTINSASKGRERMPVIQFIGISRYPLSMSEEEIQHTLLLNYPKFKAKAEADEMIRNFRTIFSDPGSSDQISDYQKAVMVRSTMEMYIQQNLERNLFRYCKISERDDDDWYHAIKRTSVVDTP
ncbi:MAG: helix-turn-helix transcriptional regulator [Lachnospiraceae bacterium]|nr:helix-turn-helix transcriptional regulator [Lachnospiraceae bacterium]